MDVETPLTIEEEVDAINDKLSSKLLETRDSISSIDSDVSLSYDGGKNSPQPTTVNNNRNVDDDNNKTNIVNDTSEDSCSDTGGKDSGCEVTVDLREPPFRQPDDDLADRIVQQVEFYFSDANVTKDAFLLKHVKRNKEGYVSLKLISSFKRVKHLTKDWRVVAYALKRSKKLQVNETGTKLRRTDPLPKYDETTPSRTVVAVQMPIDRPTIENVAELFKNCGEISLIRVLRPGNPIPADVRQFINKNPSLNGTTCSLIEFVQSESARKALTLTIGEMRVYELNGVPHPERKKKNNKKTSNNNVTNSNATRSCHQHGNCHHCHCHTAHHCHGNATCLTCAPPQEEDEEKYPPPPASSRRLLRRGYSAHFPSKSLEPAAWLQRRLSASSTEANFIFMPRRLSYGSNASSGSSGSDTNVMRRVSSGSINSSYENVIGGCQNGSCYFNSRRVSSSSCGGGSNQSIDSIHNNNNRSRSNSGAFQQSDNVLRLPRGPDGSKGFRQRVTGGNNNNQVTIEEN